MQSWEELLAQEEAASAQRPARRLFVVPHRFHGDGVIPLERAPQQLFGQRILDVERQVVAAGVFGDLGDLRGAAAEQGIELTEGEVRQAELAVFKKAYKYLEDNNLPSKMLSCSLKIGPSVDGQKRIWHLEEKTGANVVVTCPPSFIDAVINFEGEKDIVSENDRIHAEPSKELLDKLMRIPYFEKGYAVDGYTRDEYNTLPVLQKSAEGFSKATEEMVSFAASCLK